MHEQHRTLLRRGRNFSLRMLFSSAEYDIAQYSREFVPSEFGRIACADAKSFCRERDIWLEDGGDHYNSMTPYLYNGAADAERLAMIGIYNAILFWLNDTVGREKFAHLTRGDRQRARTSVNRLCRILAEAEIPRNPLPVEQAMIDLMAEMRRHAGHPWWEEFLAATAAHLRAAIRDQNARARGSLLSVPEYVRERAFVSGMYPAIALCEFGSDDFIDWDALRGLHLGSLLTRARDLTVEIGALMNDIFSFEKECITDRADFNLIPVAMLNHPGWDLVEALRYSANAVRERLVEFRRLQQILTNSPACMAGIPPALSKGIATHLRDLRGCVQATWVWQTQTLRYKGQSIFMENRLN
ncbi:terpene synthase family protein [Nocardia neocaledoniensis]|nr:terpene synthase family protein [Nocardia neocaledoniensis]